MSKDKNIELLLGINDPTSTDTLDTLLKEIESKGAAELLLQNVEKPKRKRTRYNAKETIEKEPTRFLAAKVNIELYARFKACAQANGLLVRHLMARLLQEFITNGHYDASGRMRVLSLDTPRATKSVRIPVTVYKSVTHYALANDTSIRAIFEHVMIGYVLEHEPEQQIKLF